MGFEFKKDPFENFLTLFKEAQIKGIPEANAMSLASVDENNQPSVRIVLFKKFFEDEQQNRGFCFFTNYNGRKGRELAHNSKVASTFFWPHLDQQIRIEGRVQILPRVESEKYFATRPRASQLGAWASEQSSEISSYEELVGRYNSTAEKFKGQFVPCPPHWGGYVIWPHEIEFWFGKIGRLHERYVYQKLDQGWKKLMRSP